MGRGDKKTKKGKIFKGSFGNSRKKASAKTSPKAEKAPATAAADAKPKRTTKKKAEA